MSQITTHILDIAVGSPARNVPITLFAMRDGQWQQVGTGNTNDDGRIPDSLQFKKRVQTQACHWQCAGLPSRAEEFFSALCREFGSSNVLETLSFSLEELP